MGKCLEVLKHLGYPFPTFSLQTCDASVSVAVRPAEGLFPAPNRRGDQVELVFTANTGEGTNRSIASHCFANFEGWILLASLLWHNDFSSRRFASGVRPSCHLGPCLSHLILSNTAVFWRMNSAFGIQASVAHAGFPKALMKSRWIAEVSPLLVPLYWNLAVKIGGQTFEQIWLLSREQSSEYYENDMSRHTEYCICTLHL